MELKQEINFANLYRQLREDEGLRLKPYRCTAGKLTIGYGRNIEDVGISEDEAEIMLVNDVRKVVSALPKALPFYHRLNGEVKEVLINMAFNLGIKGLLGFKKTLAYIEAGEYEKAADEMLDSDWATQVGDRAVRLSDKLKSVK